MLRQRHSLLQGAPLPQVHEQLNTMYTLLQIPRNTVGAHLHPVSKTWLAQWYAHVGQATKYAIDHAAPLFPRPVAIETDIKQNVFLAEDAWRQLATWYGLEPRHDLLRFQVRNAMDVDPEAEVALLQLQLLSSNTSVYGEGFMLQHAFLLTECIGYLLCQLCRLFRVQSNRYSTSALAFPAYFYIIPNIVNTKGLIKGRVVVKFT